MSNKQDAIKKQLPYPSEFKESAVKLATESKRSISQTAKELGINVNTLHTWIHNYSNHKQVAMSKDEHHFDEIKRLKKELARVTEERDLLKKAAAYLAKEAR
jgi:transposase